MKDILAASSVAPCGLICDLCLGFQREKNTCTGCNSTGQKTVHCTNCSIVRCAEKKDTPGALCYLCGKFPCRRLKDLEKRYRIRYGESLMEHFSRIRAAGMDEFLKEAAARWTCAVCGAYLCVHRESCLHCGAKNPGYPTGEARKTTGES